MEPESNHLGVVQIAGFSVLSDRHLTNCKVFALRESIIGMMPQGGVAAEVGVQEGHFSKKMLEVCKPAKLHLIDLDLKTFGIAERFSNEIKDGIVELHEGDSAESIDKFPDDHLDFIYIDADHTYSGVKRDIAASIKKVRRGGYMLFNDYTFWSAGECMPYGVIQAVNEHCIADKWEIVYFSFGLAGYSDVALRRMSDAQQT
jgi:hypothetical protein